MELKNTQPNSGRGAPFVQTKPSAFLNTVTLRYRPVEQGDRAAGDTVSGVPHEAQPVGEDLRGEQATVCWLQL